MVPREWRHKPGPPAPGRKSGVERLQQTFGNQAIQRLQRGHAAQAKLKINTPGDRWEREADQVAAQVMRMPEVGGSKSENAPAALQRKCAACASGKSLCAECAEKEKIRRKEKAAFSNFEVPPGVSDQIEHLRGGGKPLP